MKVLRLFETFQRVSGAILRPEKFFVAPESQALSHVY